MAVRPVSAQPFPSSLTRHTREIDEALRAVSQPEGLLGRMTAYHLGWVEPDGSPADHPAGKRIRPALVCWAAEAGGGTLKVALPAACAVELVHNFTLVHDDVQDGTACGEAGPRSGRCGGRRRRSTPVTRSRRWR